MTWSKHLSLRISFLFGKKEDIPPRQGIVRRIENDIPRRVSVDMGDESLTENLYSTKSRAFKSPERFRHRPLPVTHIMNDFGVFCFYKKLALKWELMKRPGSYECLLVGRAECPALY